MIGQAPLSPLTGVPGWESVPEQELLLELARQVPANGVIVEIGGEFGMSASLFCKGAKPSVHIFTIDLFPGDLLSKHRANLAEAGYGGRSQQIQGDSRHIAQHEEEIDLLFIDGDHTYEGVLADLNNWTPFVKAGGVLVLHDVACQTNKLPHLLHYEVKRALDAWRSITLGNLNWEWVKSVDSTVVLKRVSKEITDPDVDEDVRNELGRIGKVRVVSKGTVLDEWTADDDEPAPEAIASDLDDVVHEAVEPEKYTEPAPPSKARPKGRPRKSKK